MVIADLMRRVLVRTAKTAGADDPESVAHDVVVQALEGELVVHTRAQGYLRQVVHHLASKYRRHPMIHYLPQVSAADGVDAYLDVKMLIQKEPQSLNFLLKYIETKPKSGRDKIKAMRIRRQLRKLIESPLT